MRWEVVDRQGRDKLAAGAGSADAAASDAAPVSGRRVAALARARIHHKAQGMGFFFPHKVWKTKLPSAPVGRGCSSIAGLDTALPGTALGWGGFFSFSFCLGVG